MRVLKLILRGKMTYGGWRFIRSLEPEVRERVLSKMESKAIDYEEWLEKQKESKYYVTTREDRMYLMKIHDRLNARRVKQFGLNFNPPPLRLEIGEYARRFSSSM
jgi:hypothetical protein